MPLKISKIEPHSKCLENDLSLDSRGAFIDPQDSLSDNQNMNKILLVYEDYPDLMSMETTLRKVGFDVIGLTNEVSVPENILSFNPDLVFALGRGPKVSSLNVGKKLKEMSRWTGKTVLILPSGIRPQAEDILKIRMDLLLDAPVTPKRAIQVIAKLLNRDEAALLERLQQYTAVESNTTSTGSLKSSSMPEAGDAIYVKGNKAAGESAATDGGVGSEETDSEETRLEFKFGARTSSEDYRSATNGAENSESVDILGNLDLAEIENQISGGGAQKTSAQEVIDPGVVTPESALLEGLTEDLSDESSAVSSAISEPESAADGIVSGISGEKSSQDKLSVSSEMGTDGALAVDGALDENGEAGEIHAHQHSFDQEQFLSQQELDLQKNLLNPQENESDRSQSLSEALKDSEFSSSVIDESFAVSAEELEEIALRVKADLDLAEAKKAEKRAKYAELGQSKDVKPGIKGTVTRVGARRRQKDLRKDINEESVNDIDQLRRDFTAAMFKK